MSEMVSSCSPTLTVWSMPNSGICSGTPCRSVSSHRATTVLDVPKSTARRPGMNPSLYHRFIDHFSLIRHTRETDGHRLAGGRGNPAADRCVQVRVEGHLIAGLPFERDPVAFQRAHHAPG